MCVQAAARSASASLAAGAAQRYAAAHCLHKRRMKLQTESVGESRQIVENPDYMRDLQASHLVETERAQRLPVLDRHARRRGAQLFGDRAQRPLARGKAPQLAPSPLLDRGDQFAVPAFGTQKLCVGLRSVVAILGRGGHRRDHLALGPRKRARREHHLHEQLRQRRADQRMGVHQH
jgi:hypothetical protein